MTPPPVKLVADAATGQVAVVELTAQEIAERLALAEQEAADIEAREAEAAQGSTLRQQILDQALSAVGVSLSALTAAQRNALTACLLWKAGGVTSDMKVKPLGEWLK